MTTTYRTTVSYDIMTLDDTTTAQDVADFFSGTDYTVMTKKPDNPRFVCLYKTPGSYHTHVVLPLGYLVKQGGRISSFSNFSGLDSSLPLSASVRKKLKRHTA